MSENKLTKDEIAKQRALIEATGMVSKALAQDIDVCESTIRKWRCGASKLTNNRVLQLIEIAKRRKVLLKIWKL